jgi:hypothetical protein
MAHVQTVEVFNSGATASSFTATTDITIGGGADRLAVAYIYGLHGTVGATVTLGAVTLGGVAATSTILNATANSRVWSAIAYFKAPATGALTLAGDLGANFRAIGALVSEYDTVDQTAPVGATWVSADTATENFRDINLTTTAANSIFFAGFATQEGTGAVPTVSGATLRDSKNVNLECAGAVADETVLTASAATMTFNSSLVNRNVGCAIEIMAAAGGGTTLNRIAAVAATSTFAAVSTTTRNRASLVAATSSLTAVPLVTRNRAAAIAATSTFTATGSTGGVTNATAVFAATSSLTATARRTVRRSALVAASSTVSAVATMSIARAVAIAAQSAVSAAWTTTRNRAAAIIATSTLSATWRDAENPEYVYPADSPRRGVLIDPSAGGTLLDYSTGGKLT